MTIRNISQNVHCCFFSVAMTIIIIITTVTPTTTYQYYNTKCNPQNNYSGFVLVPFVIAILRIALIVLLAHVNA
jgi:hypothetical protein